ncbi:transcriptional regulator GutM [Gemelliphila palaticanis]|uniref:Transcriptional regulator GutM n=1 Tax=Gemelliphila palaticanis TaxID=81950 RepID=A0ABX2T3C2_9BACL|nr:transcriptional regulator GutM [Gemella palaticanis]MBF0715586.1 transcriptional regulator GutM [Gemella palaticanis]NYS47516.1 transcriptional regulator GutM [Gemella palaticanis]
MNILALGILLLFAFILQYLFTYIQMQSFNKHYRKLRNMGRVVIGRKKGLFRAGAIIMLAIDNKNKVISGSTMQGVTVLARFKNFDSFNGLDVGTITERDCKAISLSKSLTMATLDGVLNYKTVSRGEEIEIKPSPLVRLSKKLKLI